MPSKELYQRLARFTPSTKSSSSRSFTLFGPKGEQIAGEGKERYTQISNNLSDPKIEELISDFNKKFSPWKAELTTSQTETVVGPGREDEDLPAMFEIAKEFNLVKEFDEACEEADKQDDPSIISEGLYGLILGAFQEKWANDNAIQMKQTLKENKFNQALKEKNADKSTQALVQALVRPMFKAFWEKMDSFRAKPRGSVESIVENYCKDFASKIRKEFEDSFKANSEPTPLSQSPSSTI